ncbi:MAG: FAD-dependent oxidoreductase [Oscillospiraceae bacterium]|nr:FAD-dependent oxidoreductase [Oscillospiraceae bacterium]
MKDVIIIGHGPAAVSAALYLRRAQKSVALIGRDMGALQKAEKIENYFGLPVPVSGIELAKTGLSQAKNLGAEIISAEVFDITYDGDFLLTSSVGEHRAKAVILATGAARKAPAISGLKEFEGRGVSYCAVCDAFFYRGKTVGVLGSGEFALHELSHLLNVCEKAYLLTNGAPAPESLPEKTTAITEPIAEIVGENVVTAVKLKGGEEIALSGVFVAQGSAAAADFARKMGIEVANGSIVVDNDMKTAIDGVFAAGDCTGGFLQVATAVSEGAKAAMSALAFLKKGAS